MGAALAQPGQLAPGVTVKVGVLGEIVKSTPTPNCEQRTGSDSLIFIELIGLQGLNGNTLDIKGFRLSVILAVVPENCIVNPLVFTPNGLLIPKM